MSELLLLDPRINSVVKKTIYRSLLSPLLPRSLLRSRKNYQEKNPQPGFSHDLSFCFLLCRCMLLKVAFWHIYSIRITLLSYKDVGLYIQYWWKYECLKFALCSDRRGPTHLNMIEMAAPSIDIL